MWLESFWFICLFDYHLSMYEILCLAASNSRFPCSFVMMCGDYGWIYRVWPLDNLVARRVECEMCVCGMQRLVFL